MTAASVTMPAKANGALVAAGKDAAKAVVAKMESAATGAVVDGAVKPEKARKRKFPGNPDPNAEVIAMTRESLLETARFVCEVCGKGFQRDQNLQLHRRGHNLPWNLAPRTSEPRKRVYVCPEVTCVHHDPSRALGDLTGIKKHYSRKHGEKRWECGKCNKKYAVQSDWKAHQKQCGARPGRGQKKAGAAGVAIAEADGALKKEMPEHSSDNDDSGSEGPDRAVMGKLRNGLADNGVRVKQEEADHPKKVKPLVVITDRTADLLSSMQTASQLKDPPFTPRMQHTLHQPIATPAGGPHQRPMLTRQQPLICNATAAAAAAAVAASMTASMMTPPLEFLTPSPFAQAADAVWGNAFRSSGQLQGYESPGMIFCAPLGMMRASPGADADHSRAQGAGGAADLGLPSTELSIRTAGTPGGSIYATPPTPSGNSFASPSGSLRAGSSPNLTPGALDSAASLAAAAGAAAAAAAIAHASGRVGGSEGGSGGSGSRDGSESEGGRPPPRQVPVLQRAQPFVQPRRPSDDSHPVLARNPAGPFRTLPSRISDSGPFIFNPAGCASSAANGGAAQAPSAPGGVGRPFSELSAFRSPVDSPTQFSSFFDAMGTPTPLASNPANTASNVNNATSMSAAYANATRFGAAAVAAAAAAAAGAGNGGAAGSNPLPSSLSIPSHFAPGGLYSSMFSPLAGAPTSGGNQLNSVGSGLGGLSTLASMGISGFVGLASLPSGLSGLQYDSPMLRGPGLSHLLYGSPSPMMPGLGSHGMPSG